MIERSANTRQTLLYNERKIPEEDALLLAAFNFPQDAHTLTFDDKLQRLRDLASRNERVRQHTLHFSVNFHPADDLTDKKMKQIAAKFLRGVGFADQPALVYRHLDAGHPHLHIVTTSVKIDGDRINNDLLSLRHRIQLCREISDKFSLTQALPPDSRSHLVEKAPALRLQYGKIPTKTGIQTVLNKVLKEYAFTSLEQLNAALSLYNVKADRGHEQGIMYKNKGLYYRMLDDNGQKVGAPIKASAFQGRPTLKYLEIKFEVNKMKIGSDLTHHQNRIRKEIDQALTPQPPNLDRIIADLKKQQIQLVIPPQKKQRKLRRSPKKQQDPSTKHQAPTPQPDFFFIDLQNKTIHAGASLGEQYTASALLKTIGLKQMPPPSLAWQQAATISRSPQQTPSHPLAGPQVPLQHPPQDHRPDPAKEQQELTLLQRILQKQPQKHRHSHRLRH